MDSNTPPVTQPVFGRAQGLMAQSGRGRGLLLSAAEATVGVARGATFTILEPQQRPGPSSDPMTQHVRLPKRNRRNSDICSNFISFPMLCKVMPLVACRSGCLHMVEHQHSSPCLEE